jgi:hypothetical protein
MYTVVYIKHSCQSVIFMKSHIKSQTFGVPVPDFLFLYGFLYKICKDVYSFKSYILSKGTGYNVREHISVIT